MMTLWPESKHVAVAIYIIVLISNQLHTFDHSSPDSPHSLWLDILFSFFITMALVMAFKVRLEDNRSAHRRDLYSADSILRRRCPATHGRFRRRPLGSTVAGCGLSCFEACPFGPIPTILRFDGAGGTYPGFTFWITRIRKFAILKSDFQSVDAAKTINKCGDYKHNLDAKRGFKLTSPWGTPLVFLFCFFVFIFIFISSHHKM